MSVPLILHIRKCLVLTFQFDLKFTKGNTVVTFEKLWFLQKQHAQIASEKRNKNFEDMIDRVQATVQVKLQQNAAERLKAGGEAHNLQLSTGIEFSDPRILRQYIESIVSADANSYTTAEAFTDRLWYFFTDPELPDPVLDGI